jgi:hypothetical protein
MRKEGHVMFPDTEIGALTSCGGIDTQFRRFRMPTSMSSSVVWWRCRDVVLWILADIKNVVLTHENVRFDHLHSVVPRASKYQWKTRIAATERGEWDPGKNIVDALPMETSKLRDGSELERHTPQKENGPWH